MDRMLIGRTHWSHCRFRYTANLLVYCAGRSVRLVFVFTLSSMALFAGDTWRELRAEAPKAGIVGLGATTCQRFNDDVRSNPLVRRDYLAWAQGFMSGILLSRPAGVDEGLDLNPTTFGLVNQLHFLEDHCAKNTSLDFSDAVEALYKRLRQEGKT
jgi:hypothetical protein